MSMISSQIDELRERAKELRNLAPDPAVPYLVPSTKETMALAMRSAASEMEDAADTIWQLRDDLQRANAAVQDAEHDESMAWDRVRKAESENAKLRDELAKWERLAAGIVLPEYPVTQFEPKDLERENAKLRELVRVMAYCNQYSPDCDGCRMNGAAGIITERAGCDELLARLRELGLGVTG